MDNHLFVDNHYISDNSLWTTTLFVDNHYISDNSLWTTTLFVDNHYTSDHSLWTTTTSVITVCGQLRQWSQSVDNHYMMGCISDHSLFVDNHYISNHSLNKYYIRDLSLDNHHIIDQSAHNHYINHIRWTTTTSAITVCEQPLHQRSHYANVHPLHK